MVNTATQGLAVGSHYVPMRVAPGFTLVGNVAGYDVSVAPNLTSIGNSGSTTEWYPNCNASGFTVGRPFKTLVGGQTANYIAASARM